MSRWSSTIAVFITPLLIGSIAASVITRSKHFECRKLTALPVLSHHPHDRGRRQRRVLFGYKARQTPIGSEPKRALRIAHRNINKIVGQPIRGSVVLDFSAVRIHSIESAA